MIKLIPDARISWRFKSVQATLLLALVSSIQTELFPVLQPLFTPDQWRYVLPGWTVLIFVLRNIAQPALEPKRQQLESTAAHEALSSEAPPAEDPALQEAVEAMARALYRDAGLSKAWEHVSAESKDKWRHIARGVLQRGGDGGEHF